MSSPFAVLYPETLVQTSSLNVTLTFIGYDDGVSYASFPATVDTVFTITYDGIRYIISWNFGAGTFTHDDLPKVQASEDVVAYVKFRPKGLMGVSPGTVVSSDTVKSMSLTEALPYAHVSSPSASHPSRGVRRREWEGYILIPSSEPLWLGHIYDDIGEIIIIPFLKLSDVDTWVDALFGTTTTTTTDTTTA